MPTYTSRDLQRRIGEIQDAALVEPVVITRNGRERLVILSADEFRRLKHRAREVLWAGDLSDADLKAIRRAKAPSRFKRFDVELPGE